MSFATAQAGLLPAQMRKVPPDMADHLLRRGEWSLCAMEHSRLGPVRFEAPAVPFHHLALPLERVPLKFGLQVEGRRHYGRNAPDTLTIIEAGVGGTTMWDAVYESACLYFTTQALCLALGRDVEDAAHRISTRIELHAPALARLLHALHADAAVGQPHGALVGDAIFVALAAQLVPDRAPPRAYSRPHAPDWRVRRALEYIHAGLTGTLDLASIAAAAATSPFHLNRTFRATLGCSIWQYVLRERARCAIALMHDPRLSLGDVAHQAGFETYASFIAAVRGAFGQPPARLRRALIGHHAADPESSLSADDAGRNR